MTLRLSPRTIHHLSRHYIHKPTLQSRGKTMTTSTSTTTIPILLIGATLQTGSVVSTQLKPEYEVIHFIQSLAHAKIVIPQILSGHEKPETGNDAVGTLNFSSKPQAVAIGGAFDLATVEELRAHVSKESAGSSISWLARGPDADTRLGPYGPGYAVKVVESVKNVLARLREEGTLGKDEIHFW